MTMMDAAHKPEEPKPEEPKPEEPKPEEPKPEKKRRKTAPPQPPKVKKVGSRRDVYLGKAEKTAGGLGKADLILNKYNRVVSKRRQQIGIESYKRNRAHMATPFAPIPPPPKAQ